MVPIIGPTGPSRIELWQNNPATPGRRTFSRMTGGVDALTSIPDAYPPLLSPSHHSLLSTPLIFYFLFFDISVAMQGHFSIWTRMEWWTC
jgi:hypothetical protein